MTGEDRMEDAPALSAAVQGMLDGAAAPPLVALLSPALDWWEGRHLELMAAAGFDDVRRSHNAVFVNLPAGGCRLTDLAAAAGMTKQAMAELVDDLVAKRYVAKIDDPEDGRAKLLVWSDRGEAAHQATMRAFADIDREVVEILGTEALDDVRDALGTLVSAVYAR